VEKKLKKMARKSMLDIRFSQLMNDLYPIYSNEQRETKNESEESGEIYEKNIIFFNHFIRF